MSFAKMQEALRAEGWFVEWNMPCCQSCAWAEVEHDDLSKVLFNHSQDCEIDDGNEMECSSCEGDGMVESSDYDDTEPDEDGNEQYVECDYCAGEGYLRGSYEGLDYEPDVSVSGFACMPPESAGESLFCFDGSDQGVLNFKSILSIIEGSGCKVDWNGSGDSRPLIEWSTT